MRNYIDTNSSSLQESPELSAFAGEMLLDLFFSDGNNIEDVIASIQYLKNAISGNLNDEHFIKDCHSLLSDGYAIFGMQSLLDERNDDVREASKYFLDDHPIQANDYLSSKIGTFMMACFLYSDKLGFGATCRTRAEKELLIASNSSYPEIAASASLDLLKTKEVSDEEGERLVLAASNSPSKEIREEAVLIRAEYYLMNKQRPDQVIMTLSNLGQIENSNKYDYHRLLGISYYFQQNYSNALDHLLEAKKCGVVREYQHLFIERWEDDYYLYFITGDNTYHNQCMKWVREFPNSPDVALFSTMKHLKDGDYPGALNEAERAWANSKQQNILSLLIGILTSVDDYRRLFGLLDDSDGSSQSLPNMNIIKLLLAICNKEYQDALSRLWEIENNDSIDILYISVSSSIAPDGPEFPRCNYYKKAPFATILRGLLSFWTAKYNTAKTMFQEAITINSDDRIALWGLWNISEIEENKIESDRYKSRLDSLEAIDEIKEEPLYDIIKEHVYRELSKHRPFMGIAERESSYSATNILAGSKTEKVDVPDITQQEGQRPEYLFFQEGDYWTLSYGGEQCRIRKLNGLIFIHYLLSHPGDPVHVSDLVKFVDRPDTSVVNKVDKDSASASRISEPIAIYKKDKKTKEVDVEETIEYEAIQAARDDLRNVEEEMALAVEAKDTSRDEQLNRQYDGLKKYIRDNTDYRGRPRKVQAAEKKAQERVQKAITRAVERIREYLPDLADHLSSAIETGFECVYKPLAESSTRWQL